MTHLVREILVCTNIFTLEGLRRAFQIDLRETEDKPETKIDPCFRKMRLLYLEPKTVLRKCK